MAEKRKNNPEWVKQKNEANRIYAAKQREDPDHRESVNMYRRVLWAINEEYKKKTNDRVREWINENRDRWRAKLSLRRYREAGAEGEFTDEDIELIHGSQQFQCVYCGVDTSEIYHVDHITPIARGGSSWPSNLQILCPSCNCSKRDKTHEEYLAYRSNLQMAISEAAE
jgi:5-methylcytosine-specific restriction endonuclease McrA